MLLAGSHFTYLEGSARILLVSLETCSTTPTAASLHRLRRLRPLVVWLLLLVRIGTHARPAPRFLSHPTVHAQHPQCAVQNRECTCSSQLCKQQQAPWRLSECDARVWVDQTNMHVGVSINSFTTRSLSLREPDGSRCSLLLALDCRLHISHGGSEVLRELLRPKAIGHDVEAAARIGDAVADADGTRGNGPETAAFQSRRG